MDLARHERARGGFDADLSTMRPPGVESLDAHAHLGRDEDGAELGPEALLAQLDVAGGAACVRVPPARPGAPSGLPRA